MMLHFSQFAKEYMNDNLHTVKSVFAYENIRSMSEHLKGTVHLKFCHSVKFGSIKDCSGP